MPPVRSFDVTLVDAVWVRIVDNFCLARNCPVLRKPPKICQINTNGLEVEMSDFNKEGYLNWLKASHAEGKIGRREFMGRAAAAGVLLTAGTMIGSSPAKAATPKKGGHMKLAMGHGSTTDTIDPAIIENGFQWTMMYAIANPLTEIAADGSLQPALAESWDVSDDATTWSFKLRKGVEFQDGKPFTSADVLANLRYHTKETSKSVAKPIMDQIAEMKADGDHEVSIKLHSGNADFAFSLSSGNLAMFPAAGEADIDWKGANGTGGYKLDTFEPGVSATFSRMPNYWKDGAAHADTIQLLAILDAAARTNALITGEVHAIDQVDLKTAERLKRVNDVHVEETTGPLHYEFTMQADQPPFNDVNVRRALKSAVDREELLSKILQGHGSIGNDHPIGPSYPYHAADLEQTAYDPDKAKWHLKQSGLSSLTVDISTSEAAFAGATDAAILFQESAKKAGITINVLREPADGYWSNVWGKKPWCLSYWGGYATPDEMYTTGYAEGAAWNTYNWVDPKFQELMKVARSQTDPAERAATYREMQRIGRDDGPTIIPMFANAVFARRSEIEHAEHVSALRAFDGRQIIERWWMA